MQYYYRYIFSKYSSKLNPGLFITIVRIQPVLEVRQFLNSLLYTLPIVNNTPTPVIENVFIHIYLFMSNNVYSNLRINLFRMNLNKLQGYIHNLVFSVY